MGGQSRWNEYAARGRWTGPTRGDFAVGTGGLWRADSLSIGRATQSMMSEV